MLPLILEITIVITANLELKLGNANLANLIPQLQKHPKLQTDSLVQPCKFNSSVVKTPKTSNGFVGVRRNGTSTWHIYDPLTNIDFCPDNGSNKNLLPAN